MNAEASLFKYARKENEERVCILWSMSQSKSLTGGWNVYNLLLFAWRLAEFFPHFYTNFHQLWLRSQLRGRHLEGVEGDGGFGVNLLVLFHHVIVLATTDLTDLDFIALEPKRQKALSEALVVSEVCLLELDEGLRAHVTIRALDSVCFCVMGVCRVYRVCHCIFKYSLLFNN